jgi:hypothetical protein
MEDSIRFADQSKALWLQHNNGTLNNASGFDGSLDPIAKKYHKGSCVGRCPFASIIATIITLCGTGVFSGCLYRALSITIQMVTDSFRIEMEMQWVRWVQTIVIVISAVMGGLCVVLLIVGCLATGATRSQVFTGFRSRLGGRISTGFFIFVVYVLFLIWFAVTATLVVPIVAYYMLMKNCAVKTTQINTYKIQKLDECLSLQNYGINLSSNKNSICSNELIVFCNQVCFFFRLVFFYLIKIDLFLNSSKG